MKVAVIVAAAGAGDRLGLGPKALVEVRDRPLLGWVARAIHAWGAAGRVVVTAPAGSEARFDQVVRDHGLEATVVAGGATRAESVRAGLEVLPEAGWDAIVCHDAARPFATADLFGLVVDALAGAQGVVPVVPVSDTVKRVDGTLVVETLDRAALRLAQTPQAFRAAPLHVAHAAAAGADVTDDASLLERSGYAVGVVPGDPANLKVTTAADLALANAIAADRA